MTDDEIVAMLTEADSQENDTRVCTWCKKREEKYGDHKGCAICMETIYCSKACQKKDWKRQHKAICTPAAEETSTSGS